jgi:hypothetical protein
MVGHHDICRGRVKIATYKIVGQFLGGEEKRREELWEVNIDLAAIDIDQYNWVCR